MKPRIALAFQIVWTSRWLPIDTVACSDDVGELHTQELQHLNMLMDMRISNLKAELDTVGQAKKVRPSSPCKCIV